MLPPTMSTSSLQESMVQSTASLCGGLSTSGPSENTTEVQLSSDQSKMIAYAIWIYMGPVIFFIGLTGNILILVVMSCKRMRGTSTSDYLIIMAVADLLTIITGMVPEWLEAMDIFVLQASSPAMCKIYKFVSYACGDTAIWIRVLFTLDRFMAICFPMKKTDCCLAYRAKYYCLGAALAAIAKNLHVFWTRGAEYETKTVYEYVDCVHVPTNMTNTTLKQNCGYPTPEYRYFEIYVRPWIVFTLVNFIPFCIILVCNIFIVRAMIQMTRMRKQRHLSSKTSDWQLFQTTAMCLGASFTFLICVTPTMVILIGKPYWTMNGTNMAYEIAKSVSNQLTYLNSSVNFFLYCITGKKFRETLGLMLRCRCKEVMTKSDVSASRAATVRPYTLAAGINGIRGECASRQNSKPDGYSRQTSVQSVSFDVQALGKRTVLDKVEENVVVEEMNGRTTVVEKEEGIVTEDVVMTELAVESVGETRKRGDQTAIRNRSGSESSSGVSSSTSNGEHSPTTLNLMNAGGYSSQHIISCASTNQSLANNQKDNCRDHSLVKDHDLAKDHGLANGHGSAITQYSDIIPDRTNASVTDRTNSSTSDSCQSSLTSSKLRKNQTTPNVSPSDADNCEYPISLESKDSTSQKSWEEQKNDLEKIKTDNSRSVGTICKNNNCCDVKSNSDSVCAGKLEKTISSGNAECKKETGHELEFHGIRRMYTKDEILDELPDSVC